MDTETHFYGDSAREIFDHIATGIAVYEAVDDGADFVFKDINPAGVAIGKTPREAHLGRRVTEVYPGVRAMGLLEIFRKVWQTGVSQRFPLRQYKDDRIELWVENYVFRLPSGHIVAVYEDKTAQKKAEEEKNELIKHIHRIQKMESLATLAAGIAHDFNNLLMPILGYAQMGIDHTPADQPACRYFQRVLDAAKRAKDLVNQILLLSRDSAPAGTGTDLVPILKECVKLLRAGVPKNVDISYGILPERAPVQADPSDLHQILMNLAVNAYQAVKDKAGKVCLSLECPCRNQEVLKRVAHPEGHWVHLSVSDNGPGVPVPLREKIFDPYFTTKGPEQGTGLGLFITAGVVRRLGGTVWVEDASEGGAAFHVLLPGATQVSPVKQEEEEVPARRWNVHVLAIDDEPDVRSVLQAFLGPMVQRLTLVESPEKAITVFHRNPSDVDLVFTDYSMPGMTGFDVAKAFKALRPNLPVVLLTGYRSLEELASEQMHLVERVVYKPVTRRELFRVLDEVLPSSQRRC
ncbi:MAG: ATP-binding protein [Desulfosoma sp.]